MKNLNHDNAKEFCRIASNLMVKHNCFLFVVNNKLYLQDKKNERVYDTGEFYDGIHFADLNAYSDEELNKRIMPWK